MSSPESEGFMPTRVCELIRKECQASIKACHTAIQEMRQVFNAQDRNFASMQEDVDMSSKTMNSVKDSVDESNAAIKDIQSKINSYNGDIHHIKESLYGTERAGVPSGGLVHLMADIKRTVDANTATLKDVKDSQDQEVKRRTLGAKEWAIIIGALVAAAASIAGDVIAHFG